MNPGYFAPNGACVVTKMSTERRNRLRVGNVVPIDGQENTTRKGQIPMLTKTELLEHMNIDIRSVAEGRHGDHAGGIPTPLVDLAKYWCALATEQAPRWSDFRMEALNKASPHMTVLHKIEGDQFAFEFCGSAISTLIGQDLTGETVTSGDGTRAEINWAERMNPVLADGQGHLRSGFADPQYTASIDFLALDLPLLDPDGEDIGYIIGCTVPVVN